MASNLNPEHLDEAIAAVLFLRTAAVAGSEDGGVQVWPYQHRLDDAEDKFTTAAGRGDIEGMVAGWNDLTDATGQLIIGLTSISTVLLATVVNGGYGTDDEIMTQVRRLVLDVD